MNSSSMAFTWMSAVEVRLGPNMFNFESVEISKRPFLSLFLFSLLLDRCEIERDSL